MPEARLLLSGDTKKKALAFAKGFLFLVVVEVILV